MRRLPKMASPNEDCNIVRLCGTAFFRPPAVHPCRLKIAVSVYPCIVALIADIRPCPPFAGICFSGDRVPDESDKTPRVPPCRPCAGHDAPGLLSDLTQNVKEWIETKETEDSDRRKRGFLRLRKKAGIKRAVSHRTIHIDRQQPTAISGENKSFRELWRDGMAAFGFRIHTRKV